MLDIVLGIVVLVSVVGAAFNGLTKELLRIASLVVGLFVAMWGYGVLAGYLAQWISNAKAASIGAFALLFIGCVLAGALLAQLLSGLWSIAGLGVFDKLLGAAFGALRGLLLAAVLLLMLVAFQPLGNTAELIADSRIAPVVLNLARTAAVLAPEALREAFRDGLNRDQASLAIDRFSESTLRPEVRLSARLAKPDHEGFRLSM